MRLYSTSASKFVTTNKRTLNSTHSNDNMDYSPFKRHCLVNILMTRTSIIMQEQTTPRIFLRHAKLQPSTKVSLQLLYRTLCSSASLKLNPDVERNTIETWHWKESYLRGKLIKGCCNLQGHMKNIDKNVPKFNMWIFFYPPYKRIRDKEPTFLFLSNSQRTWCHRP